MFVACILEKKKSWFIVVCEVVFSFMTAFFCERVPWFIRHRIKKKVTCLDVSSLHTRCCISDQVGENCKK